MCRSADAYTANNLRAYQIRYQFDSGRNSWLESECKGNIVIQSDNGVIWSYNGVIRSDNGLIRSDN